MAPRQCGPCYEGNHGGCVGWVATGFQVPDDDPRRDGTRMVPEWVACTCGCQPPADEVPL